MKSNLFLVWAAIYLFLPFTLFGHGGRTDSLGCHNDRQRGGYHCHSGPLAGRSFASKAQATAALEKLRSQSQKSEPEKSEGVKELDWVELIKHLKGLDTDLLLMLKQSIDKDAEELSRLIADVIGENQSK